MLTGRKQKGMDGLSSKSDQSIKRKRIDETTIDMYDRVCYE